MSEIEAQFDMQLGEFTLNVELTLPGQGVIALFGDSGSGKTTLLRAIAGLEQASGSLSVNGEVWQSEAHFMPVHQRPIGYVFQEASLFSHLNVRQNLAFGLKRIPRAARQIEMSQVVEWLGIEHLLKRMPQHLSGGERQRVAIGRALLTSPRLLMMDEPLSALDERSKHDILPYLERLHDELAIPVLYVSHSVKEVSRLADHMVWLEQGRVKASGSLQQMMSNLELAISHEDEASAVLETEVVGHDEEYQLTILESRFGKLQVRRCDKAVGEKVRVNIPAKDVSLSLDHEERSSILNIWEAVVIEVADAGHGQVMAKLCCPENVGNQPLLARITRKSRDKLDVKLGTQLYARIKSVGLLD
ncbi:molybdenum ABC transporter ATP-binding protein [Solemya pervernicosa gill symbiont]|uniref:Molybdenum ABC transporter ATP-binding protein n=2 Tax=Gammaproteobacteria incertae sedis TaxID=118884 RepID=A0A1T2L2E5_9GAMM|nr:molybdenum ABC transporter ATP-binding protein [Candidatus Reidiella endopervernicosa]OOZ39242.1 molybdenum ABC transporter ATP-binding protein [Solemya pervernicosa gill symbiont]QKQ25604.1 molybdenum ABC transporter ATP-binding protein [Candidatus Reidiella endopervernicosa]